MAISGNNRVCCRHPRLAHCVLDSLFAILRASMPASALKPDWHDLILFNFFSFMVPPGPLPHYPNTTILNDINGASGTADLNDA